MFVAAGWDEVLSPASRYARSPGKKVSVEKVMFSKGCKLRKFVAVALLILFYVTQSVPLQPLCHAINLWS